MILSKIGASPDGEKILLLFNMPWKKAAIDIKPKKGNMRRVRKTVSSNSANPNSGTRSGVIIIPAITVSVTVNDKNVKKQLRNSLVFSLLFSRRYSLKVGIKATAIEPSANSLLNRLGIRNAIEKASESALVPKRLAFVISRKSPRTRETSVSRESVDPCRIKALELSLFWF